MSKKHSSWKPLYAITPTIARGLVEIETARAVVEHTPLSPAAEAELRHRARIRSTHYSTRIEGNRLTLKEAQDIIEQKKTGFHGRERDVKEVRNYWDALLKVEDWAERKTEFGEDLIKRIHAIVERGKRAKATPYRGGQNVIRDSGSGEIIYMPPEEKDVPGLMNELVRWVKTAEKERLPVPIIAALAHYQFVTIHPYFDGNGRTARLLATFILQKDDYGLNRFFSMEEHHARDLSGYYNSLAVHGHHNYYMGRADAELTPWIEYFVGLLARVFTQAKDEALRLAGENTSLEPDLLRRLDRRARVILALFSKKERITAQEAAATLGLSSRMVRVLLNRWTEDGLLTVADASNRGRSYNLSAIYRQFIGIHPAD
jgi:Fic family protein